MTFNELRLMEVTLVDSRTWVEVWVDDHRDQDTREFHLDGIPVEPAMLTFYGEIA